MDIKQIDLLKDYVPVIEEAMVESRKYPPGITYPEPAADYFGCFEGDVFVGFFGIKWRKGSCYFRSAYVPHVHRKKGIYSQMVDFTINLAKQKNVLLINIICTPPSLPAWVKRGAVILKEFANNNTKIKLEVV